ncbi:acyl carrier protein [Ruminococcus champanellensis]|uniref:Phosphopantetheine attachment site n=1 Tax=Ruminococcus champanellensis (strain DSM 18848 / JCM 17042 / KCTC 15320 / 18P13) TaxID=213810 RepID=D4L9Q1_RUMC1|nr:acyl carrier protein [Ruminococcus champanellensis]MED9890803.1 phosphopantetheine-binding protein [Ruminococcus champanellensis]CBL16346.1 Phosphopantetheine attachment site [Ruminococcus champanellensis 18P13 = JCM 17042]
MNQEQLTKEIKEIWMEILESEEELGTEESFFEVGGNSMLATMMVENINDRYGCGLELNDIYEYNTIVQLAEFVASHTQGAAE